MNRAAARLCAEGCLHGILGMAVAAALQVPEAGLWGMLFAAISLHGRVWLPGGAPEVGRTAAVGVGLLLACTLAALLLPDAKIEGFLGHALDGARMGHHSTLADRRLGGTAVLLPHNLAVLLATLLLTLIYRGAGLLIMIAWSASVWSFVLVVLGRRGLMTTHLPTGEYVLLALAGVLPHLLLEGLGYIAVGTAALTLRARGPAPRAARLFLAGTALIVLAAVVESHYAPRILGRLH